ncbi:MAG: amidohydrolase [Peptoniphilaceae bacterium]|jgi:amidohydrolase|nr:amidohydrolase [Bacillota bacterium]
MKNYVQSVFQTLHATPEPAFQETKTAAFLARELKQMGYTVETGLAQTGIRAEWDTGKEGPVFGIRADMDALPYEIDGRTCYRHTCGHDANASMALSAAKRLIEEGIGCGKLVFLFQPAEEIGQGARAMIQTGRFHDLTHLVGLHIRPRQDCQTGEAAPAVFFSAAAPTKISISGVSAHGARPHEGINAVEAAVSIANAVAQIKGNPNISHSVKVTKINTGAGASNAIPDAAEMGIDARSEDNAEMERIRAQLVTAIPKAGTANGATVDFSVGFMPATEYDEELTALCADAISDVLGEKGLIPPIHNPGSEDFAYYARELGIKTAYIGIGADASPGLHHKEMTFNHDALVHGEDILVKIVHRMLG